MAERERSLQEELERIYGNKNKNNQPKPTVTIKGTIQKPQTSQIKRQIEKARKNP